MTVRRAAGTAAAVSSVSVEPLAADLAKTTLEVWAAPLPAWFAPADSGGRPLAARAFPSTPETATVSLYMLRSRTGGISG